MVTLLAIPRERRITVDRLSDTLNKISTEEVQLIYPNIMTILHVVHTFSATSASVERTNSALRVIKNIVSFYDV